MRRLREWVLRFGGLFNKQRKDWELEEEIESHLQLQIEDNLRLGMTPEEARRQAMIKLGGIESTKEAYRDQRGLPWLEILWQDIRYGARMLRKNPGFTAVAVLTLALGIGATTAIFSLINAVLLEPLPYEQPGRLVYLWETRGDKQPGDVSPGAFVVSDSKYGDAVAKTEFAQRTVDRISAIPGVDSAGFAWNRPMQGFDIDERSMRVVGRLNQPEFGYSVKYEGVVGDYFRALGVPLLRGRTFLSVDNSTNAAPVVVCSEALARKIFPNEDPIGKFVQFDEEQKKFEIVGMVGDVKLTRITDNRSDKIYFPQGGNGSLIVRTRVAPLSLAGPIRKAILEVDGDQPVSNVRTLAQDITHSLDAKRQTLTLLGLFAVLALGLAALGLYGVLAHAVVLRRQEIGIRMALGAQRKDVLRLILRNGMRLTLLGVGLGLAGAFALTGVLRNQLYQVATTDPGTFAAVALLLGLVAFFACLIPARRAARVDPMVALRYE